MCNSCNCSQDAYDRCSIVGYQPIAFCCELCVGYENRHSCENYIRMKAKVFGSSSQHIRVETQVEAKKEKITPIIGK